MRITQPDNTATASPTIELGKGPVPRPDAEGRSYSSLASFSDPDGNQWLLQEVTERIPRAV
jgi:hypothetical protein